MNKIDGRFKLKIRMVIGDKDFAVTLLQSAAPKTCTTFWNTMPLDSYATHAKFAGGEFFFMVPFFVAPENQLERVTAGDVAYYPEKQTVCIFYGRIHPFAKVNVFGRVTGDLKPVRRAGKEVLAEGTLPVSVRKQ